jgi:hypothetical protein
MSFLATGNVKGHFQNNKGDVISEVSMNAVNDQAFEAGDILVVDNASGKFRLCTSGDLGPFYWCKEAKAETELRVAYLKERGQQVTVHTDNILTPFCYVKPSTSNDGHVMKLTEGSGTLNDVLEGAIGIYRRPAQDLQQKGAGKAVANSTADSDVDIQLMGAP